MRRRSKILLVASGFALVFAVGALRLWELSRTKVNVTDEQLKETLNRELPEGTSKANVRQSLDRRGWSHTDVGSNIKTMIRDAGHNFLVRTDIQIQFSFTPEGKLLSYELKDYFTGP